MDNLSNLWWNSPIENKIRLEEKIKTMNVRNFLICYYTSEKDATNFNNVNPKKAVVSSDDEGRINEAWIIEKQLKLGEDETFILWQIQRID